MNPTPPSTPRRLQRSRDDRMIAGVAGGIAEHLGADVAMVRLVFVALAIFGGSGLLLYVIAWVVVPDHDPVPDEAPAPVQPPMTIRPTV